MLHSVARRGCVKQASPTTEPLRGTAVFDLFTQGSSPLATLGYYLILALLLALTGRQVEWSTAVPALAGALMFNAAVAPLLFLLTSALAARYGEQFRTVARP